MTFLWRSSSYYSIFWPHIWWVETVWAEFATCWEDNNLWLVTTVFFDIWWLNYNQISWRGYSLIPIPAFEIVQNFPFPKFWKKDFYTQLHKIKSNKSLIYLTHTRFFFSSILWWFIAKLLNKKRVHVEHWSWFVDSWNYIVNFFARVRDELFWRAIFHFSDKLIGISLACKNFMKKFTRKKEALVIYRGVVFPKIIECTHLKKLFPWKIIIWYIWRVIARKNVDWLVEAFKMLPKEILENSVLVIIWDGSWLEKLKESSIWYSIHYTWKVEFSNALQLQSEFDIHVHPSHVWGWLATTLLQAMYLWSLIVATCNEWGNEVITSHKNGILLDWSTPLDLKLWIEEWFNHLKNKEKRARYNKDILINKFNRNKIVKKYYSVFNNLLIWYEH